MVLDDAIWSCWIRYAVLALRTIVDHLCCLCCLSFWLVLLGSWQARLSARLTALFANVKFWFHHGTSCLRGSFIGMVWLVGSWMSWVMLVTARRVSPVPWRFEMSIRAPCMCEAKLPQSALRQQRRAFWGSAFEGRERVAVRELLLYPKYYRVGIRIRTKQEGIGNSSHGLRMASRDRATDTVGARLGSTDSVVPGGPWAKYRRRQGKRKRCRRRRQPWWSS